MMMMYDDSLVWQKTDINYFAIGNKQNNTQVRGHSTQLSELQLSSISIVTDKMPVARQ